MFRVCVIPIVLSGCLSGFSQELERQLISSSGSEVENVSFGVSWSIGEVVVSAGVVGEGFHYPAEFQELISSIQVDYDQEIVVHPNPTNDFVTIKIVDADKFSIRITDLKGLSVKSKFVQEEVTKLDLRMFRTGIYLLSITKVEDQSTRLYKIIKK